jgi:SAM-dependent methyltransferase
LHFPINLPLIRQGAAVVVRGYRHEFLLWYRSRITVQKTGISSWYEGTPSLRPYARFAIDQVIKRVPREGLVIEAGTGLGQIPMTLAEYGYRNVVGIEYDSGAHAASLALRSWVRSPCTLLRGDCLDRETFQPFSAVSCFMALNWTYQHATGAPAVTRFAGSMLAPGGVFLTDLIRLDFSPYHTSDAHLPVEQRRPTEYPYRWPEEELVALAGSGDMSLVEKARFGQRWVYVFVKKPE